MDWLLLRHICCQQHTLAAVWHFVNSVQLSGTLPIAMAPSAALQGQNAVCHLICCCLHAQQLLQTVCCLRGQILLWKQGMVATPVAQ
jgi:hypothetical protein